MMFVNVKRSTPPSLAHSPGLRFRHSLIADWIEAGIKHMFAIAAHFDFLPARQQKQTFIALLVS
jgi:hypothetical protein